MDDTHECVKFIHFTGSSLNDPRTYEIDVCLLRRHITDFMGQEIAKPATARVVTLGSVQIVRVNELVRARVVAQTYFFLEISLARVAQNTTELFHDIFDCVVGESDLPQCTSISIWQSIDNKLNVSKMTTAVGNIVADRSA